MSSPFRVDPPSTKDHIIRGREVCNGPQNLDTKLALLRWWAALKMKESQCPERARVPEVECAKVRCWIIIANSSFDQSRLADFHWCMINGLCWIFGFLMNFGSGSPRNEKGDFAPTNGPQRPRYSGPSSSTFRPNPFTASSTLREETVSRS
jgi:hypothetical protein